MHCHHLALIVATCVLFSCGRSGPDTALRFKMEGPDIKSLSHDELIATYKECTRYGPIDDPRVKYAVRYCAAIQSAQLSEGYTAPGTEKVDPSITRMH